MASPYDEKLLAATSNVTRAELQDGYDPDLLADGSNLQSKPTLRYGDLSPLRSDSHGSSETKERDLEAAVPLRAEAEVHPNHVELSPARPKPTTTTTTTTSMTAKKLQVPFWRTRKGIAILVVIAIVIIALAAGLGGGLGSKKSTNDTDASDNAVSGAQDSGQDSSGQVIVQGPAETSAAATTTNTDVVPPLTPVPAPIGGEASPTSSAAGQIESSTRGLVQPQGGPGNPIGGASGVQGSSAQDGAFGKR